LKEKEQEEISVSVKSSNEKISQAKKAILELANKQTGVKNSSLDLNAKIQSHLARQKRLDIEKAKILEEAASIETTLQAARSELRGLEGQFHDFSSKLAENKKEHAEENRSLEELKNAIQELEKTTAKLISQKDFLDKLKLKYEEEAQAMNAVVLIEGRPREKLSGIVVKINAMSNPEAKDKEVFAQVGYKLTGEAKPIPLNTEDVEQKINEVTRELEVKSAEKSTKESKIQSLNIEIETREKQTRELEMLLNSKSTEHKNISEQLSKINEEKDIVELELSDVGSELEKWNKLPAELNETISRLDKEGKAQEELIHGEQTCIASLNLTREENLVIVTQTKTELLTLEKRAASEGDTLKTLDDTYRQDKAALADFQKQIEDSEDKVSSLSGEIKELEEADRQTQVNKERTKEALSELGGQNKKLFANLEDDTAGLDEQRRCAEDVKTELYNLQMQNQEWDFKLVSIKDRMQQGYKVDLDSVSIDIACAGSSESVAQEIKSLKEKLDSYGTVNLVAIEEYEELKTRYDFLNQQQTDLNTAKGALHEAINKINRTTRKMFVETFEKISVEFKNYFRMLFNGGEASVFLVDEGDPLESGIEIICRPPGKKLQNVFLLSGGEKALSAIALIFAIFKVKPSPFCILDEIDAALDEANVDRYGRMLQEFAAGSQFIVITHNKRTIANADVMYGITMEESGVSKIVSVRFSKDKTDKTQDAQPQAFAVSA
jgi:chromosome segregation protein